MGRRFKQEGKLLSSRINKFFIIMTTVALTTAAIVIVSAGIVFMTTALALIFQTNF